MIISTPISRLCLTYEFDIDPTITTIHPSTTLHDDAITKAAQELDHITGFSQHGVTSDAFHVRVIDGTSIDPNHRQLDLSTVHNLPFDTNFHVATTTSGQAIRYEFIYSNTVATDGMTVISSKLFLRIVTSFGKPDETIDGVSASRIGFMAIEILEGNDNHLTIFPQHPPIQFGIRHVLNFIHHMILKGLVNIPLGYILMYFYIALERLGLKSPKDITKVNDVPSMLRFHASKQSNEPAMYQLYRSNDTKAFKSFIGIAEKWTKALGLDGYFYLLNFSPYAAPSIAHTIQDITNVEKKYRGVFVPAGPPPSGSIWNIINVALASKIVINNYGYHKHNFTAKPVAFLWDWLHLRNSLHVAACISINGTLLSCFRGVPSSFHELMIPNDIFPNPPKIATANVTYNTTIG